MIDTLRSEETQILASAKTKALTDWALSKRLY